MLSHQTYLKSAETCLRLCLVQIIQGRSDAVFGVCLMIEISVIIFCFVIKFTKTSFFCIYFTLKEPP